MCQSALRLSVYWPTSCSQQWVPLTVPLTAEETQAQRVMCSLPTAGKWQSQDPSPGSAAPEPRLSHHSVCSDFTQVSVCYHLAGNCSFP